MNCSDSLKALVPALAKARVGFTSIQKTKTNPHYKSKYAPLDEVLDSVMPALAQHGLVVVQPTSIVDGRTVLHTRLLHESGEWMEGVYPLPEISDPQKLGAALTYARRYALCSFLGVAADEDDDGNAARQGDRPTTKPASKLPAKLAAVPTVHPSDGTTISDAQVKRLQTIKTEQGWSTPAAKALLEYFGYKSSKDIRSDEYDEIIKHLQNPEIKAAYAQEVSA